MVDRFLRGKGPLKPRPVALLLMVAGAAAFIISLISFGEQVLCLFGSTLVVFGGLLINIFARQYVGVDQKDEEPTELRPQAQRGRSAGQIRRQRGEMPAQTPAPSSWENRNTYNSVTSDPFSKPEIPSRGEAGPVPAILIQRTVDVLRQQGGEVRITNQRENRSILQVTAPSSKGYSILVYEGTETIDASDIRGLYSLMISAGADGAIFVSASTFSQHAQEWAQQRAVLLVEGSRIDEIEI